MQRPHQTNDPCGVCFVDSARFSRGMLLRQSAPRVVDPPQGIFANPLRARFGGRERLCLLDTRGGCRYRFAGSVAVTPSFVRGNRA